MDHPPPPSKMVRFCSFALSSLLFFWGGGYLFLSKIVGSNMSSLGHFSEVQNCRSYYRKTAKVEINRNLTRMVSTDEA